MKILKVWDGEYPWDVRTEKISRALTEAGHDVHMVARNRDGRGVQEKLEEAMVHRLRFWGILGRRLNAISQFPAFFNPRWLHLMLRTGRRTDADIILVRDLPLAPTAVLCGRLLGLPVILDMAENYPAMIKDLWLTDSTRFGDALIRNPTAVTAVERWTLEHVDHVLVVVAESGDRLQEEYGLSSDRITVVGNTPPLRRLEEMERAGEGLRPGGNRPLRTVYLGIVEEARGIGTCLEAIARLKQDGIRVEFTVIGSGRALSAFENMAEDLEITDRVDFRGYVPYMDALTIVQEHDVGIIPHLANDSWNTTIPNKLFDYMAAGLAVVASDPRPILRVLEETGAGCTYPSGNHEALASVLKACAEDREQTASAGMKGRAAIRNRYRWECDSERLMEVIDSYEGS